MLHFLVATTHMLSSKGTNFLPLIHIVHLYFISKPPKTTQVKIYRKEKDWSPLCRITQWQGSTKVPHDSHAGWSFYVLTVLSFGFSFILLTVWSSTSDHRITSPLSAINIGTQGETNGTINTLLRHELTTRQVYLHELVFWYMILPHSIKGTVKECKEISSFVQKVWLRLR